MHDVTGIRRAAERAGADEFISLLPDGYASLLGPSFGGTDLSEGQWQRLALGRAFFRDAPLVILDEPTASLDARAEAELFRRMRELLAGRSVVLISHRLASVTIADRIYVLRDGRLVEAGPHRDLMRIDGHYAELFRLQSATYLAAVGER
jgi:ATP-binding cassette subfamily B protein